MHPDDMFDCRLLHCKLRARVCAKRQADSELARDIDRPADLVRHDGKRGVAPEYPTCTTSHCGQGRAILHALVGEVIAGVRSGDRGDLAEQRAAQRARARVTPAERAPLDLEPVTVPHDDLVESGPVCLTPRAAPRGRGAVALGGGWMPRVRSGK